jgi:hypothetical protein
MKLLLFILTLSLLFLIISGCNESKKIEEPKDEVLNPDQPVLKRGYISDFQHTKIGERKITRVKVFGGGVFTFDGHIYCKKWDKIALQGEYVFMKNEDGRVVKRKLLQ